MLLEMTNSERQLLIEVVEAESRTMLHEIDHTDSREYRKRLQERLQTLEHLVRKFRETQESEKA
jgi:hypothetical protein